MADDNSLLPEISFIWAKFKHLVRKSKESDCWIWTGSVGQDGYGRIRLAGAIRRTHRLSYLAHKGEIPSGTVLDHLCRVRECCNPDHLEAVTNRENILRGESSSAQRARQTHCKRGHEFKPENTYVRANGQRVCRTCKNAHSLMAYHSKRAS